MIHYCLQCIHKIQQCLRMHLEWLAAGMALVQDTTSACSQTSMLVLLLPVCSRILLVLKGFACLLQMLCSQVEPHLQPGP